MSAYAIAGVEMALLDLKGKALGVPVTELLDHVRAVPDPPAAHRAAPRPTSTESWSANRLSTSRRTRQPRCPSPLISAVTSSSVDTGSTTSVVGPPNQATRSSRSLGGVGDAGVSTASTGQVMAPQKRWAKGADTFTP